MDKGKELVNFIVRQRLRLSRGVSLFQEPYKLVGLMAFLEVLRPMMNSFIKWVGWGFQITQGSLAIMVFFFAIFLWLIALIDEKHIRMWQNENEYQAHLNPYFTRLEEKIDSIIKKLK